MNEKDTPTFKERLAEVLGDGVIDKTVITLRAQTSGDTIVGVALKTEERGVIRGNCAIPEGKVTPNRILSAAEDLHATLTGAIAIFAAQTPGFEEESDAS